MSNSSEKNERKVSKKSVVLIAITILFVLGMLAFRISANFSNPDLSAAETPVNVRVTQAEYLSIYATSPVSGRVQPVDEVLIMPLASGEVTRVYVSMGDHVKKGASLFEIDKTQISTTLTQTREAYKSAETAYNRMSTLYGEGAVALQVYENAQMQYIAARESYNAASNAYSNCTVTSPIDGYVTSLSVTVGSLAAPGAPAATIADVSELKINTSVSEYLAPRIKAGDPVRIRIATLDSREYHGVITAVSPAPAAGSLTYPVTISVEDESGEVMAGMFAEIIIISDEKDSVLCVPSDSVIIKSGRSIVVVIGGENMPEFREVKTGIDNGEFVEITSGLSLGETVAVSGQQYAKEGHAVNIIE